MWHTQQTGQPARVEGPLVGASPRNCSVKLATLPTHPGVRKHCSLPRQHLRHLQSLNGEMKSTTPAGRWPGTANAAERGRDTCPFAITDFGGMFKDDSRRKCVKNGRGHQRCDRFAARETFRNFFGNLLPFWTPPLAEKCTHFNPELKLESATKFWTFSGAIL